MRTTKIFLTRVEWQNPKHDKRCNYGERAIRVIPRNTRLIVTMTDETGIEGVTAKEPFILCIETGYGLIQDRGNIGESLMRDASVVEVQPETFHELAGVHEFFASEEEVLERLWKEGKITPDDILAAARAVDAELP